MDWQFIERVLKFNAEFAGERSDEVLNALEHLERELGLEWFERTRLFPPSKSLMEQLVRFSKCLKVTDLVRNGDKLKKKLLADFNSAEWLSAMEEAEFAINLVDSGAQVTYEQEVLGDTKKPDFVADWDGRLVFFEVTRLELSAQDAENWIKRQRMLGEQCGKTLSGGCLDIYIMEPEISQETVELVLESIQDLPTKSGSKGFCEYHVSEKVYLAYDSTGSIRLDRTNPPTVSKERETTLGACIVDAKEDRSNEIKKKLHISDPMPAIAHLSTRTLGDGSILPVLVRVYRVAIDNRVVIKVIEKSSQLPANMPGVVVIGMGRSTARPYDWACEVERLLGTGVYPEISAVWLRSGVVGEAGTEWTEYVIYNPKPVHQLSIETVRLILPESEEIH